MGLDDALRRLDGVAGLVVALFACWNADGQAIFRRGERARGVGGEGAGWIHGLVEVEDDDARFVEAGGGRVGGEKAAAAVGVFAVGGVAEDEEEEAVVGRVEGGEGEVLAVGIEGDVARDGAGADLADLVVGDEGVRCGVGEVAGGDAEAGIGGVPAKAVEVEAGGGVGVLDAEEAFAAAVDGPEAEGAAGEGVGVFLAGEEGGEVEGVAPAMQGRGRGEEGDFAVGLLGGEQVRRCVGEDEGVAGGGADGGGAGLEVLEGDKGEPAEGGGEAVGAISAFLGVVGGVVREGGWSGLLGRRGGGEEQEDDGDAMWCASSHGCSCAHGCGWFM